MNKAEIQSFKEDVRSRLLIDEGNLNDECAKQPAFYEEVTSGFAEMKAESKKAKSVLEYVKAELERAIRTNPEKYGVAKTTETAIVATVIVQDEYQTAVTNLREAERIVDSVQACVFAVEQRKSMIRDLVTLFGNDYINSDFVIHGNQKQAGESRAAAITRIRSRKESDHND